MPDRKNRMIEYHARSGKTHDLPDLFPHLRFIAMNLAIGTECFIIHEWTFVTPFTGILRKGGTFRAEPVFCSVLFPAEQPDHQRYDLLFFFPLFICTCFYPMALLLLMFHPCWYICTHRNVTDCLRQAGSGMNVCFRNFPGHRFLIYELMKWGFGYILTLTS